MYVQGEGFRIYASGYDIRGLKCMAWGPMDRARILLAVPWWPNFRKLTCWDPGANLSILDADRARLLLAVLVEHHDARRALPVEIRKNVTRRHLFRDQR